MSNQSMDDIFYRNKRIREFMQHFREKDIGNVMRDIALLGIELLEELNPGLMHIDPDDVENSLATYAIERAQRAKMDYMNISVSQNVQQQSQRQFQQPFQQQTHHQVQQQNQQKIQQPNYQPEFFTSYDKVPTSQLQQNPTYDYQVIESKPALPERPMMNYYDQLNAWNQSQQISDVEPPVCNILSVQPSRNIQTQIQEARALTSKSVSHASNKAVPAGIHSYLTIEEKGKRLPAKSPTKWRDDSIYEPKQSKYKINNRVNTDEINQINEAMEHGMTYPNWWGDTTEEKEQFNTLDVQNPHNLSYQLDSHQIPTVSIFTFLDI
jgi:hypothetical protein